MPRALGGAIGASRQRENRGRSDTNGSGWLDSYDEWPDGNSLTYNFFNMYILYKKDHVLSNIPFIKKSRSLDKKTRISRG